MHNAVSLYGLVAGRLPRRFATEVYARPWLTRLIRGTLSRLLPENVSEVTVRGGPVKGARLRLYPRNEVSFASGLWEYWVADALEATLRRGDVAWDVGAYIGYFTLVMARACGPKDVYALEPDGEARARLRWTLTTNGAGAVHVGTQAIGKEFGRGSLNTEEGHPAAGALAREPEGAIEVTTLDGLLDTFPAPRLVKLDVEGREADALRGASRMLEEIRPVFLIELHGEAGREAVEILLQFGYDVHVLNVRERATHQEHVLASPRSPG